MADNNGIAAGLYFRCGAKKAAWAAFAHGAGRPRSFGFVPPAAGRLRAGSPCGHSAASTVEAFGRRSFRWPAAGAKPADRRLSWNLHQLFEFLRTQRLAQVLELDRIGHQVAQSYHTVWNYHLLGIEFLAHPSRILDADLGEFRIDFDRLVARVHP